MSSASIVSVRQTPGSIKSRTTYDAAKSDGQIVPRKTARECVSQSRDAGHMSGGKRRRQTDAVQQ